MSAACHGVKLTDMIEIYVLASLLGVGYIITRQQGTYGRMPVRQQHAHQQRRAFSDSVYYNQAIPTARGIEERRARIVHAKSEQPSSNYVGRFYREQQEQQKTIRNLAGDFVPTEGFLGKDVKPFFGGAVRQVGLDQTRLSSSRIETFTGIPHPEIGRQAKKEVEYFGDSDAPSNVFGNAVMDSRDRIVTPMTKRNELPFAQERVGPGNYDVDINVRDAVGPKTVDELRAANRPKMSGTEGRMMPGGMAGPAVDWSENMSKDHRLPTKDKGAESYIVTTGAFLKPQMPSDAVMRNTVRGQTTDEQQYRVGSAIDNTAASYVSTHVAPPSTRKDTSLTAGNGGYVTNVFKALTAPVMDVLAFTLKDVLAVSNTISFAQPQVPSKPTMPAQDKPETTMKETLVYDGLGTGYVKGPEMTTVFTDQVAKTTIKETLEFSDHGGYVTANKCMAVYDPESIAVALKTTMRETMVHAQASEYLRNTQMNGVVNPTSRPEDDLRVTLKDLDASAAGGILFGPTAMERTNQGYVTANVVVKDTTKHEMVERTVLPGAFVTKDMGYTTVNANAKDTTKQFTHTERFGVGDSTTKKEADRSTLATERTNCNREEIVEMRVPGAQGPKGSPNVALVGMQKAVADLQNTTSSNSGNMRVLSTQTDRMMPGATTVMPKCVEDNHENSRFEIATMLKPLQTNPFVRDALKNGDVGV